MAELESLEFTIKHDASKAFQDVNKLSKSLEGLGKAFATLNFNDLSSGFKKLQTSISSLKDSDVVRVEALANAMEKLSAIKSANIGKALTPKVQKLKEETKKTTSSFDKLSASIKRIAFYRLLRTVLKDIGQAFKEGFNNMYQWSKLNDGHFSQSMDRAASAVLNIKNALAVSFYGVVESLIPLLEKLADTVITVANNISRFVAMIRGVSTYTAVKKTATEYQKIAGSTGKIVKDLMKIDEINRLSDNSGGAGGSSADYSDMFEEMQTGSIGDLSEHTKGLIEAFRKIGEGVRDVLTGLYEIGSGIWKGDSIMVIGGIGDAIGGLGKIASGTLEVIRNIVDLLNEGLIYSLENLSDYLEEKYGNHFIVVEILEPIIDKLKEFQAYFDAFVIKIEFLIEDLTQVLKDFAHGDMPAVEEDIKQLLHDQSIEVQGAASTALENSEKVANGTADASEAAQANIRAVMDAMRSLGDSRVDSIVGEDGSISFKSVIKSFYSTLKRVKFARSFFRQFADGGFPKQGEMFIARESGAEMVGSIGGQTAVANNDQIVEAVSAGVYRAVVSAMGNGNQNVNVYLDGKQISNAVTKNQSRTARAMGVY